MTEIDVLNFTFWGVSIGALSKTALIVIMVSMGLTLRVSDFKLLAGKPKPIFVGLLGQIVILPAVGVLLAVLFQAPPQLAMGLIIIAACPGGATSNFMTYLAKGDVALSIVLTALSGLIAVVTVPFVINFGLDLLGLTDQGIRLPVLKTIWNIFMLTALPVMFGMVIRSFHVSIAAKAERILTPFSFLFLIFIMALIAHEVRPNLWNMLASAFLPVIALNGIMVGIGEFLGRAFGLSSSMQKTIGIEVGFQNYTLGIVIAIVLLNSPEMTVAPIIYLFSMYATGAFVVARGRHAHSAAMTLTGVR